MQQKPVLLIAFYNKKALGVRCLERSLADSGHDVVVLFMKDFDSRAPGPVTEKELMLLKDLVSETDPGLVGLSVMSSLYLDQVIKVSRFLHDEFSIPQVWGGAYASLFPEESLDYADFVLRGECEKAIVELADAVLGNRDFRHIKNLAYKNHSGGGQLTVVNELRPLCEDLDRLGHPLFKSENKYFIDGGRIIPGDPMLDSMSYELSASRGCPFVCSFCSSANIRRMYAGKGRFVRYRSPEGVINELREAAEHIKGLKFIHFWDEIFPDDRAWIDDFAAQYRSHIGLPFVIWGHPLRTSRYVISKLADAGLYKVVMGIQSGSPRVRNEIFRRRETQEKILEASAVLAGCRVPQVTYDLMLRHPFETEEDIRQTFELCTELRRPFELQLHGLYFLPGTDIIKIAEKHGMPVPIPGSGPDGSIKTAFRAYWGQKSSNAAINFWYSLIYMTQLGFGLRIAMYLSKAERTPVTVFIAAALSRLMHPVVAARRLCKKALMLSAAYSARLSAARADRHAVECREGE